MLLTRVFADGRVMTTGFDGAGVLEAVSARIGTATTMSNTACKMGFADPGVMASKAVALRFCTAMMRANERERHPISEKCLLPTSSDSTLAVIGAVSLLVVLGGDTESGGMGVAWSLAGVVLTIRRIDSNGTYCLADMYLLTALDLAPLVVGVTRS